MTSISAQLAEVRGILLDHGVLIRNVDKKVENLVTDVGSLLPRSYLPPIRKPVQGRDYVRDFNVAAYLRETIREMNEGRVGQRYIAFESTVDDDMVNGDAMQCLEGLFNFHIPNLVGKHTWKDACNKDKKGCETVIREAASMPEFAVFIQGAYWWPIRELAKQKMKSKLRNGKKPTSVNDMNQNEPDSAGHSRIDNAQSFPEQVIETDNQVALSPTDDEPLQISHNTAASTQNTGAFNSSERKLSVSVFCDSPTNGVLPQTNLPLPMVVNESHAPLAHLHYNQTFPRNEMPNRSLNIPDSSERRNANNNCPSAAQTMENAVVAAQEHLNAIGNITPSLAHSNQRVRNVPSRAGRNCPRGSGRRSRRRHQGGSSDRIVIQRRD